MQHRARRPATRSRTRIGTVGGFKVERYVDAAGHDCAYYDTTLLFPTNVLDAEGGVNVLDMADPANPALTDAARHAGDAHPARVARGQPEARAARRRRRQPRHQRRAVDVYDISKDCRHPVLKSTTPIGFLGHESGMAPDGHTFYSASPRARRSSPSTSPIPRLPRPALARQLRLARPLDQRRRQPRLRRRHRLRADHPRHLRGPGARSRTRRSTRSPASSGTR